MSAIIYTCVPIAYKDALGRLTVEKALDLCRVSQVWGCAVSDEENVILLSKTNLLDISAVDASKSRSDFYDCYNAARKDKLIIRGTDYFPGLLKVNCWQIIRDKFADINATMEILRKHGVCADNLYGGKYLTYDARSMVFSEELKPAEKDHKSVHVRLGCQLSSRSCKNVRKKYRI